MRVSECGPLVLKVLLWPAIKKRPQLSMLTTVKFSEMLKPLFRAMAAGWLCRDRPIPMNHNASSTNGNLEAAFSGESMANRKYLFFADVAKKLGHPDLAKLFRDTAAQETEHAFAHFRLLHPELTIDDPTQLSEKQKQAILSLSLIHI